MRLPLSLFQSLLPRLPVALCLPLYHFTLVLFCPSAHSVPAILEKRSPLMSFPAPSLPLARFRFLPCPALSFYPCPFLSVSPSVPADLREEISPYVLPCPFSPSCPLPLPASAAPCPHADRQKFLIIRARKNFFCKFSNKTANTVVVKV